MDNEFDRYCIKIRTIFGIDEKIIHEELTTAFEPDAPLYRTVSRWTSRFHERRGDVNDGSWSGRPVSELTDENIELSRQITNNDPHSTYDEIIVKTSLSRSLCLSLTIITIERILHDCLEMKKSDILLGTSSIER